MRTRVGGSPMARAVCVLALLCAPPVFGQGMGGGMGGSSSAQGYITAPPVPNPDMARLPRPPEAAEKQGKQPDKCKTCVNCLTETCRRMCWQRYCRK
ncbi:hypothetical protein G3580_07110 [Nitrogeniibacter mangrovi]|uniref:Uncharacterized protein n=1 Tax=Nitrogeniibacter mangrovi TaxID=2016596 RepID=A0A6C1B1D4_9RHOO|nr:hypothetical protein [Nitrogeniibacter mangrovi]QID17436.1 hypothetical protein G3580_07110 [Nitrogeniibacter mangrovi]